MSFIGINQNAQRIGSEESLTHNFSILSTEYKQVVPTWFNTLPINILSLIFQHFEDADIRSNIIPVSRYIHDTNIIYCYYFI